MAADGPVSSKQMLLIQTGIFVCFQEIIYDLMLHVEPTNSFKQDPVLNICMKVIMQSFVGMFGHLSNVFKTKFHIQLYD